MKKKSFIPLVFTAFMLVACHSGNQTSFSSEGDSSADVSSISFSSESSDTQSSLESIASSSESSIDSSSTISSSSESKPDSSSSNSSSESFDTRINVVINNLSGDVSKIINATEKGKVGDKATFEVEVFEQYNFEGISAKTSKNRNVILTSEGNNVYSFTIPSDGIINVTVSVTKKTVYQRLYIVDNNNLLKSAPQILKDGSYTYLDNAISTEDGYYYYSIPENSKVSFSLPNPSYYETLGISFNSQEFSPDSNGKVSLDFTGITGNLIIRTFGSKKVQNLVAVNSAHLTISFYSDAGFNQEITEIGISEQFYIKIDSTDMKGYVFKSLTYSYVTTLSDIEHKSDISEMVKEEEEKYYWAKHESPSSPINENGIIYTVEEDDLNKYINEPFIGNYLSVQLFTYTAKNFTEFNSNQLKIIGSGKTTYGSKMNMIQQIYYDDNNVQHLSDREEGIGNEFLYKNGILLASNNGNNTLTSLFNRAYNSYGDDMVCFQMEPDSKATDYQLYAASFKIEDVLYNVVTCYKNGEYFKGALISKSLETSSANRYAIDVTIDMVYGEHVTDDKAIYKVMSGENQVLFVGFSGNGGNSSRMIPQLSVSGIYTNAANEKLIVCDNNAVYNDELYSCSVNENVLTLTSASKDYVMTLNFENKTFEITNSVIRTLVLGPFAGKEYRLRWYPNGINHEYGYYIKFSETEPTMSCICDVYWDMTITNHSTSYFGLTKDAVYVYDETTGDFTAQIFGYQNQLVTVTFHYDGAKISFDADQLSGGQGVFTTGVATLDQIS